MIRRRATLATVVGLTAALALTGCGGGDTALNTSSGTAADQTVTDLSQARPSTGDQQAEDAGGADQGDDVSAAGGDYGTADGYGSSGTAEGYGSSGSGQGYGSADAGSARASAGVLTTSLRAKKTKSVGTIVVDGRSMTLYRFDRDVKGKPSTCYGGCAAKWPPALTNGGEPRLRGVDASLVGKVKRADGSWQLTLAGWPLYRYALDKAPGDWNGIGVGGVWWAITPTGKKAQKCMPGMGSGSGSAASNSSAAGSGSAGYSGGSGYAGSGYAGGGSADYSSGY